MNRAAAYAIALSLFGLFFSESVDAGRTYEGSFSASYPDQIQSCHVAQDQAERIVREQFRSELANGSYELSIGGKRCECSRNNKYATPLYDCVGYASGMIEAKQSLNDERCIGQLTSSTDRATWTSRMSAYLSCVRKQPGYNKIWDADAMQKVRDQQRVETN